MPDMVKLSKDNGIVFDKQSLQPIKVTLRWNEPHVDVDLGCLVRTDQGVKVLQGLGNLFGSFDSDPYAHLDKDARSGGDAEVMRINLTQAKRIRRVLVYAYIYEGGKWGSLPSPTVTVEHPEGTFVIDLVNGGHTVTCALFELFPDGNGGLQLEPLIDFYKGSQADMSADYDSRQPRDERFNIQWGRGRK